MLDHPNSLSTKWRRSITFPSSKDGISFQSWLIRRSQLTSRENPSPFINSLASSALRGLSRIIPLLTMTFITHVQNQSNGLNGVQIHKLNPPRTELERSHLVRGDQKGSQISSWSTVTMELQLDGLGLQLNKKFRLCYWLQTKPVRTLTQWWFIKTISATRLPCLNACKQ